MLCFMMWMSGSTLHLFSIMTTLSGIYQPLSGALGGWRWAGPGLGLPVQRVGEGSFSLGLAVVGVAWRSSARARWRHDLQPCLL